MAQTPEFAAGELIIKLKSSATLQKGVADDESRIGIASIDVLNQNFHVKKIAPLLKPNSGRSAPLHGVLKIRFTPEVNPLEILSAYESDPNIEYVQPNYIHQLDYVPDDSLFGDQTYLQIIRAEAAWDIQLGSPEIIVGVIDTGIDYNHSDLRDALWINSDEDLNGNGRVDSNDFNGIDDDGNGFVDDLRGWDFTDAPSFPDGGDFETPDNDPFDEHGHGTSIAGIIGASGDNRTGIAGLAFGCRVMNLRAGTSLGLLEEDDVAAAIVYAIENGARVINMSFGDDVASPLLRDVMQFAYNQNSVLVASSGNSGNDKIHYPSGLAETISVGATNNDDQLAGFSSYGSSVDVVAPGVNLLTTNLNNRYHEFSGTSASAPIVSALAALILSKTPRFSNETVKGLILSTSKDLGSPNWDNSFASGRIDAAAALASPFYSMARITRPRVDQAFASGLIAIHGTAAGALLDEYALQLGVGETPATWSELFREKNRQVIDESLFDLNITQLIDTLYTLRLIVQNKNNTTVEDKVRFFIDRTPPVIFTVRQTLTLDGDRHSLLVEFETDDLCDAVIHFRPAGSSNDFQKLPLRFRTTNHRALISQQIFFGDMEFFIEATNGATVSSNSELFGADLSAPPVGGAPINQLLQNLPTGYLLSKSADFDGDSFKEIILNEYDNFNFQSLKFFEFDLHHFEEVHTLPNFLIPRDWGDSDGDGLLEIFCGSGSKSFIYEAGAPNQFPANLVWADTTNDLWASRFADIDRDGRGEIILRLDETFSVWETTGDNQYALVDSFPNPTVGSNSVGVPRSEIGDFDGDGQLEILFGDFDGDVYIYENRGGNQYEFTWSDRQPLIDTIDYLSSGDFDGDGVAEFVVGCHTDPSLDLESEFDSRRWLYRIYKRNGDNSFVTVWEQVFSGFQSPQQFDAGVCSGDIDNDVRPEILINVFPDYYIVDYDPNFAEYRVIWHAAPNRSNSAVVDDFDRDGRNEFYFNTGDEIVGYQLLSEFNGPPTPLAFNGRPLGPNLIELTWLPTHSRNGFHIYRDGQLIPFARVESPPFLDNTVLPDREYRYTITAIDSSLPVVESLPTPNIFVKPGAQPFLEQARYLPPNQVQVTFSEIMDQSVRNPNNYEIETIGALLSAISHRAGKEIILTSPRDFSPGNYRLVAKDVADADGTPIDTTRNFASFEITTVETSPYLIRATLSGANQLLLEFNEAMDAASVGDIANYVIEPNVQVASASRSSEDSKSVLLQISSSSPIGPFGIDYVITVRKLKNLRGTVIRFGQGDSAALVFSRSDLKEIFAYPNPYRSNSGQDFVILAGLTRTAIVRILDASGRLLRTLQETDGNGGVQWDLKDEKGNNVPSGIYILYVVGEGEKGNGKLAIMR